MKHPQEAVYVSTHRFGDSVSLYIQTDEKKMTAWLSATEARATAEALLRFADDIDARGFLESTLSTIEIVDSE